MVGQDNLSVVSHRTDSTCTTVSKSSCRNFLSYYEAQCKKRNTNPLREVKVASSSVKGTLNLTVDKIKYVDWIPLLKTVANDKTLHSVAFKSRIHQGSTYDEIITDQQARELKKGPVLLTVFMLNKFTEACHECLEHSKTLRMFQLEKIPLTPDCVASLSQGVSKTWCLQKLILVGCRLGDEGCQHITEAVKKVPSIRTLDLSSNDITHKGAKQIADLLKFQDISRYSECWKHSLRCRDVNIDVIPGLRRISINNNTELRDKGLKYIIEALFDDNWIKAIDAQNCGITDRGCTMVKKLVEANKEIVVFDLRRNDIVNVTAIASIISELGAHTKDGDLLEFGWMDTAVPLRGSSEDSSSGGGSCSSYNLSRANEKVAKYVESTAFNSEQNTLRAIQSAAALGNQRANRPVQTTIQRSCSTTIRMPNNLSETNLIPQKTRSTSSVQNVKPNKVAVLPPKLVTIPKPIPQPEAKTKALAEVKPRPSKKTMSLRSTQSDGLVPGYGHKFPASSDIKRSTHRSAECLGLTDKEKKQKKFKNVTYSRGSEEVRKTPKTPSSTPTAMNSNDRIEMALQKLFESFGESSVATPDNEYTNTSSSYIDILEEEK